MQHNITRNCYSIINLNLNAYFLLSFPSLTSTKIRKYSQDVSIHVYQKFSMTTSLTCWTLVFTQNFIWIIFWAQILHISLTYFCIQDIPLFNHDMLKYTVLITKWYKTNKIVLSNQSNLQIKFVALLSSLSRTLAHLIKTSSRVGSTSPPWTRTFTTRYYWEYRGETSRQSLRIIKPHRSKYRLSFYQF